MNDEYFKELLRSRSLKATSHRLNLLIKLQAYNSAMPYSAIQEAMKSMDRVTLYPVSYTHLRSPRDRG